MLIGGAVDRVAVWRRDRLKQLRETTPELESSELVVLGQNRVEFGFGVKRRRSFSDFFCLFVKATGDSLEMV